MPSNLQSEGKSPSESRMTTKRVNQVPYASLFQIRGSAFRLKSSAMSLNDSPKPMGLQRGYTVVPAWAWPFRSGSSSVWGEEYGLRVHWEKEASFILRFNSAFHKARVPLRHRLALN